LAKRGETHESFTSAQFKPSSVSWHPEVVPTTAVAGAGVVGAGVVGAGLEGVVTGRVTVVVGTGVGSAVVVVLPPQIPQNF